MVVAALYLLLTDWGGFAPHNDTASTFSPCYGSASRSPAFIKAWHPQTFCCFFLLVFLGLAALFFFLLGWWGSPCRVFPPPCFLVLGGWVGDFSYLLRLASFFLLHLGQPGHPTRNPPGPHSPLSWRVATSPISCWELSVGRAETKGCGVTGGL